MKKNESFNTAAELYDEVRPSYDQLVIDWIINKSGVTADDQLLEIGPGTGQATIKFAETGLKIHCVEYGDKLAAILKQKCERYPNVTIDISAFETWKSEIFNQFKLIYSAAAFHWIEKDVKYKKCYQLLSENGYLALLWHDYPDESSEIINKAYELLNRYSSKRTKLQHKSIKERRQEMINEINESGFFEFLESLEHQWMIEQTPEHFLKGFMAQSSILSLEDTAKKEFTSDLTQLLLDYNKPVKTEFITTVYLAQKEYRS